MSENVFPSTFLVYFKTRKKKVLSRWKYQTDVPARGSGGGLFNGLSSDDLDDDEAYVDEDSDELMAIRNTGNRLGGQASSTHDSRYQSAFGVCWKQTNDDAHKWKMLYKLKILENFSKIIGLEKKYFLIF